jgi:hypothetical protein
MEKHETQHERRKLGVRSVRNDIGTKQCRILSAQRSLLQRRTKGSLQMFDSGLGALTIGRIRAPISQIF